jgi:geranylgeranyl diphosphate synthase type II
MTFDLSNYLTERRRLIEAELDRLLPAADEPPDTIHKSMRYSVLAPGKRLRPTLTLAAAETVGGSAETVLPTACALECIHVFSLIHDDLPCMDDDDYRRGLLTNHKVYGEAMALLAGDALMVFAFELIASNAAAAPPDRVLETIRLVARATGTCGMVGGQVVDMLSEGLEIDAETLRTMHSHKTGALLTVSILAGALLAGGAPEQCDALRSYGEHVGLAFQIADDILDVTGDEELIGKPVGSDVKQDKATYVKLFGLAESHARAQEEAARGIACLDGFGARADALRAIARYVVERRA